MPTKSAFSVRPGVKRYLSVLISLAFGIFLLWLITRGQDFELIAEEFRHARYFWIIMAAIASIASHLARALRWKLLIEPLGPGADTAKTYHAVLAGYLFNLAIPRLGEITRCMMLSRMSRLPFNSLIGTVVAERVFDMFSLIVLILLIIAFQFGFLKEFLYRLIFSPLMEMGANNWLPLTILALAGFLILAASFFFFRKKLADPGKQGFYFKLKRQLLGLKFGLLTIYSMRRKWLFLLYSMTIWVLYFLTVYFCFFAIESTSHLTAGAGITLLAVGSLGIVAPVPGGIGTYHFLTTTTLGELYGIAAEPAISYAYIAHATQMLVILVAGSVSWMAISLIIKNVERKTKDSVNKQNEFEQQVPENV